MRNKIFFAYIIVFAILLGQVIAAHAQSFYVIGNYPNNGGTAEVFFTTNAKGDLLQYSAASSTWLYDGHTAYKAKIVYPAIPAIASSKNPIPATPSSATYYAIYSTAAAAFRKL